MLYFDLHTQPLAFFCHAVLEGGQVEVLFLDLCQHDHCKEILHDGLADIHYVHFMLGHYRSNASYYSYSIDTYNGNNKTA